MIKTIEGSEMNLIEQLGGYEKSKEVLELIKARDHKYSQNFERPALEKALLQHRRENNIFEVGDLVVVKASPFWPEDYVIHTVEQEYIGKGYMSAWRHATDAEIKAGHRL